jgi:RNA polymerase sigma-70 factor (ECF subfamily)
VIDTGESTPATLIGRAQRGDRDALSELLGLAQPHILRWCRRRVTAWIERSATAEDIAQEACLAVLLMLPCLPCDDESFWRIVYGIVDHKIVDAQRRVGRSRTELRHDVPERIDDTTVGPEDRALNGEDTRRLACLLSVLPEEFRLVLWLRLGLGLPADEVAAQLGGTAVAIRVRQHRGLVRLRRHLAVTIDQHATHGPPVVAPL